MQEEDEDNADISQRLSALADGELEAESVHVACGHWRDEAGARERWHAYHLIGDVLRSDALASDAAHDERFLRCLRARLAAEPTVLAPQPLPAPTARRASVRWTWLAPAAVAAGFMAVASVLVVTRGTLPATGGERALIASSTPPPAGRAIMATAAPPRAAGPSVAGEGLVAPQTLAGSDRFFRDARLDRYLAAHMEFGGSSALGAPSGFLRAATSRMPDR